MFFSHVLNMSFYDFGTFSLILGAQVVSYIDFYMLIVGFKSGRYLAFIDEHLPLDMLD